MNLFKRSLKNLENKPLAKRICIMRKADFDLACSMASCPNGPGDSKCSQNLENQSINKQPIPYTGNSNDEAYYQDQQRQGDLYQIYGTDSDN